MKIVKEAVGPCSVISWADSVSLEGNASTILKEELKSVVRKGASRVVIDLTQVEFIDSSGLGALISALKALRSKEGLLYLFGVTESVANILEITRLDRVFDIAEDRSDALVRCGAGPDAGSEVAR